MISVMPTVNRTKKPRVHLLLPPTVKDFASCFSENAIRVSDSSCSSNSSVFGGSSGSSSSPYILDSSVKSAVSCLYSCTLSTQKSLLINVTWSKSLSIALSSSSSRKPMTNWVLKEKVGKMSYTSRGSLVCLYWNLTRATYSSGPEPLHNFYVVVVVDEELALSIGDMSGEFITKLALKERVVSVTISEDFRMVSRREQAVGRLKYYSTKARFRDCGIEHDICIRCTGDPWNVVAGTNSELQVFVDKKRVVQVTRLEYNFRGNQTLFVDGLPVDLMWDVHDWRFPSVGGVGGYAVFLFRTRSRLESRLWLEEEEELCKKQGVSSAGFSLLIEAFKSPSYEN